MSQSLLQKLADTVVQYKEEIVAGALAVLTTNWLWHRHGTQATELMLHREQKLLRKKSKLREEVRYDKELIQIPAIVLNADNTLLDEVRYLGSPMCGIENVPNLINEMNLPNIAIIPNPILESNKAVNRYGGTGFLPDEAFTYQGSYVLGTAVFVGSDELRNQKQWLAAGPRKHLFFQPEQVKAAIVTCGGLCPGLNVVIRELFLNLTITFNAMEVWGIQYGYEGFYKHEWIRLDIETVRRVHLFGGTMLGSSRGGFDLKLIVDEIQNRGINQVYFLGGDGTHKGIYKIAQEISRRGKEISLKNPGKGLEISCVGIPKTIDNDIPIIDKSFGFETAVSEGIKAIRSAWVESRGADYGIGLVRIMGRDAGWIAMDATNASRDVNVCLVPEFKFDLYGPDGLLEYIYSELLVERHLVIVVAEGAGDAVRDHTLADSGKVDSSGNKKMPDIGMFLKSKIVEFCASKNIEVTLKYIDPTYMVRTVPAIPSDKRMCTDLAWAAVNGAMAGFTSFTVGHVNNSTCMIPLTAIEGGKNKITPCYRGWQRLLAGTGQPYFLNDLPSVSPPPTLIPVSVSPPVGVPPPPVTISVPSVPVDHMEAPSA